MLIRPATLSEAMAYIAAYWTSGHPAGRDEAFAQHWLMSPWVERAAFPFGVSALMAEDDGGIPLGVSCCLISATAAWHVIWHVRDVARGKGVGMALLKAMTGAVAPKPMHVLGISDAGRPFYERMGFVLRVAVRWRLTSPPYALRLVWPPDPAPDSDWLRYRYDEHPTFRYERRGQTIVREDPNDWGHVLHVSRLGPDWPTALSDAARYDLVQAWSYTYPGEGWDVPPAIMPSVFHPVEARGNALLVAGWPTLPAMIHGSDGGQDRPPCR